MNEEQFVEEITEVVLKNEELIKENASLRTNVDDLLKINASLKERIEKLERKIRVGGGGIPEILAGDVMDIVLEHERED